MQVKPGYVVALLVVIFTGFGVVAYLIRADNTSANNRQSGWTTPQLRTYTETIDRAFTIARFSDKTYKLSIPDGAKEATIQGRFTATGGARNDVEVSVLNDDGYVNWQNRHPVSAIYNSGRVTQGTLNIALPDSGTYYLIFDNRFSIISPKAVQDNVSVVYKR